MSSNNMKKKATGEDTPLISEATPTAVEKQLPWKRNSGRQPISSAMTHSLPDDDIPRMSECPSWVDNLDYNQLPVSPAASLNISPNNSRSMPVLSLLQHQMQPVVPEEDEDQVESVATVTVNGDNDVPSDSVEKVTFSAGSDHEHDGNSGTADDTTEQAKNGAKGSEDGVSFSLPWRRKDDEGDQGPVRSPSASHLVDSEQNFAPLPSNRSFSLSEREGCLESKHSLPINLQSVISLPKYNETYPDNHDVFLEQSDALKDLPQSDEMDPDDRIHKWLENTSDDLESEDEDGREIGGAEDDGKRYEEGKEEEEEEDERNDEPLEIVIVPKDDTSPLNCDNTGSDSSGENKDDSSESGGKSSTGTGVKKRDQQVEIENKSSLGFVLDCVEAPTDIIVVDERKRDLVMSNEKDTETYV